MKLLLVTCRKIDQRGGENALIMGRQEALHKIYGIDTDIIFIHKDNDNENSPYPGIRFLKSTKDNVYDIIERLINTEEYQGIISSGFYDKKFNDFVKKLKEKHSIVYITDIHATIREIYEYCIPDLYHILGTRYLYLIKKMNFKDTIKSADYAFVVSDEEIKEVKSFCPNNKLRFIKVYCGAYDDIDRATYFTTRKKIREKFEFSKSTLAFVYSGSTDRWQKFDETLELFNRIHTIYKDSKFAFYMNLDSEAKKKVNSVLGKDNVIVRWVDPDEMKNELTAFDCGVLLRDDRWTNRVAFPNKFSDYVCCGLGLVLSKSLREPYKLARKYNIELLDLDNLEKSLNDLCEQRTSCLDEYIDKCEKLVHEELNYNTQVRNRAKDLLASLQKNTGDIDG